VTDPIDTLPFGVGDIVETTKGARFWGEVAVLYRVPAAGTNGPRAEWRADVRAVDPGFLGTIHVYPLTQLQLRPARPPIVQALLAAGWNACRKSLYAVCEDIQEKAAKPATSIARTADEQAHERGFYRGESSAATHIARAFSALDAMDDDNLRTALAKSLGDADAG